MKKPALVILATTICVGTAASSALAHHSHPFFYDVCKTVTIEGRIDRVEFKDPHTLIFLKTDDGTAYTVDWAGLRGLTNNNWLDPAKAALVFGARIAVTGARIRSTAEIREHFPDFTSVANPNTLDPALIRRVDNNWSWTLPNAPVCKGK
jgi:hypothetical protein